MQGAKAHQMELIGKNISTVCNGKQFDGKVVDETQNTIRLVKADGEIKTLLKNNIQTIKINNQTIDGKKIQARPYERIKIK